MKTLFLILLSYTTILLNPTLYTANSFSATTTISIKPPASSNDYRQFASLLVSSFDSPQSCWKEQENDISSKIQKLQWDLYEKSLTEEFTYKRYVSTVRRMRGKKYCLLVAKKANVVDEESDDNVVGMVEMGMSLCPTVPTNITSTTNDNNDGSSNNNSMTPTPLIGVICVS